MHRLPLEVADLVRSAGRNFIEDVGGQHTIGPEWPRRSRMPPVELPIPTSSYQARNRFCARERQTFLACYEEAVQVLKTAAAPYRSATSAVA
jgi:hypothetical protein